jgi:hypothetical protein
LAAEGALDIGDRGADIRCVLTLAYRRRFT